MSKEPLLTRKALRERVIEQRRSQDSEDYEVNEFLVPKKPLLERYNRFLTIWMITMIVLIVVTIGIQIFL